MSNKILIDICGYLNSRYIPFNIIELDIALDIFTDFNNILVLCTKKIPKVNYYKAEEKQYYDSTKYIEKSKESHKISQYAYYYDKSSKENLDFKLTRFELKLTSQFFNRNREKIYNLILKALERYCVLYIRKQKTKKQLMLKYDNYEINRRKDLEKLEYNLERCYFNMRIITDFFNMLYAAQSLSNTTKPFSI